MDQIVVNIDFITPYWNDRKRHKHYSYAVDITDHIRFHYDGYFIKPMAYGPQHFSMMNMSMMDNTQNPYFTRLIDQRRPSESQTIKEYRRLNYVPITKTPCHKVVNSLKKIFKSPDWQIDYSESQKPASIPEDESLEEYCEHNFPKYDSIENWAASEGLKWCLIDPNAWWVVMNLGFNKQADNEFSKPYPHTIEARNIYDFIEREWVVFLSPYKNEYINEQGDKKEGKIITTVTRTHYYHAKQINDKNEFVLIEEPHDIGELPAGIYPGENMSSDFHCPHHESFIQGMIPALDAAAGDSSDLVAEKMQHLYSTMWSVQSQNCSACQGTGKGTGPYGKQVVCPQCDGRGNPPFSPFRHIELNMNSLEYAGKNVPTPPAGYIVKPTEMVPLIRQEINTFIDMSFSAVNMEFLSERPIAESGTAKGYSQDETNNFVHNIAYHLIEDLMKPVYYFVCQLRYRNPIKSEKAREEMLPKIPIPESFDFLTNKNSLEELEKICKAEVSSDLKAMAENDFLNSKYQDNIAGVKRMMLIQNHDPLPGLNREDTIAFKDEGLISTEDCILHIYLKSFLTNIMEKEEDFMDKDFEYQKAAFDKLVQEKKKQLDAAEQIKMKADLDMMKKETAITGKPKQFGQ